METFSFLLLIVVAIILLVMAISVWKIFVKAGQPGWAAIVPIYNYIVMLDVVKKPTWWIILLIVPVVSWIIGVMVMNNLAKVFGQGGGFALGLIFLPFIFLPLLAFGDYRYIDDIDETIPAFAE